MTSQQYYVFSKRHAREGLNSSCILWWMPEGHGYTRDLNKAGKFTEEDRVNGYPDPERCVYVPCEVAQSYAYDEVLVWVDELPKPYHVTRREAASL